MSKLSRISLLYTMCDAAVIHVSRDHRQVEFTTSLLPLHVEAAGACRILMLVS